MLNHIDPLVRQEQYKDLLREAEHERVIRAAGLRQLGNWKPPRKVAGWIGNQMISWGHKLQSYGMASSACGPQVAGCQ